MKTVFILCIGLVLITGCTVRGGWPRFLRHGEAWGWNGPAPDQPKK